MNQDVITKCIYECLQNLADELDNQELANPTLHTKIYGNEGNLDSLALVSFIADLESLLHETLDREVILANERAMSATNSPFRDVETLCNYILMLIND
ncbi:hypothetical protein CQA66_00030 [Helicobacter aurati]|uniref:Carrier domain-containing protein n=1 Tax=Helicobacter aurati TaxID=137778 RepID=A0A3D8J7Y1_9HELI|nr:hypothetical protein [Helicobacter aurati]RDU73623.1 hypothetical protein CQA66_00030 [Helicobacter aurati]